MAEENTNSAVSNNDASMMKWIIGGMVAIIALLILIIVAGAGIGAYIYVNYEPDGAVPTPAPVVQNRLAKMFEGHPEKGRKVAALLNSMAYVLEHDTNHVIETTTDLRQANTIAGQLALQGQLTGPKFDGLGGILNKRMKEAIGTQRVDLSDSKREKAVDVYESAAKEIESVL